MLLRSPHTMLCWIWLTSGSEVFSVPFGGARRDEERARAKERVLSFRDEFGQWEPRAQRVALQLVAIVKLTRTALLYSDPDLRRALLQDLESNEGVRVYPRETTDKYRLQPDESLNRLIERDVRGRLGNETIIAQSVNDIPGVWPVGRTRWRRTSS